MIETITFVSKEVIYTGKSAHHKLGCLSQYLASCSDVLDSILTKSRALVRNFKWSGLLDKQARAKVKWAMAIIPTIKGGLKVFDPMEQAKALVAKLIRRARILGKEPWKSFIRHRRDNLQLRKEGDWGCLGMSLQLAHKVKPQGSMLWQATWKAWIVVKEGTQRIPLQSHAEFMRQPLYLNPAENQENGRPYSRFRT